MIERHTSKDQEGEGSLEAAKKTVYVLIAAGIIMWLAPELLFSDTSLTGGKTDNPNSEIAQQVQQFTSDTQIVATVVLYALKYVLLAATIGAITSMRIRRRHPPFLSRMVDLGGLPPWSAGGAREGRRRGVVHIHNWLHDLCGMACIARRVSGTFLLDPRMRLLSRRVSPQS